MRRIFGTKRRKTLSLRITTALAHGFVLRIETGENLLEHTLGFAGSFDPTFCVSSHKETVLILTV